MPSTGWGRSVLFAALVGSLAPHLISCGGGGIRRDGGAGGGGGAAGGRGAGGGGDADGAVADAPCGDGNVIAILLDPATATATLLEVTVAIGGRGGVIGSFAHEPGRATQTIDWPVDPSSAGQPISVLVIAIRDGNVPIGNGTRVHTAGVCGPTTPVMVQSRTTYAFLAQARNKIDILVVINDSLSMMALQTKFLASFGVFIDMLRALPAGFPDLHLAVVSSNTGPGRYSLPERQCPYRGDEGRFQRVPRGTCASPFTDPTATFLAATANQATKNYSGDITDAFNCIAALGTGGCSFGGPLKAARWALDPFNVPAGNENFLRQDADLAVIVLTNQDDCSLPDDSDLMNPNQTMVSDPLGPLTTFRCSEFGHLCKIGGTLQPPPRGPASNLQDCESNEGPSGLLSHVTDEVAFLKSLKDDPARVTVAVIAGPPTPYSIENVMTATQIEPRMVHSCDQSRTEYGAPAVRLAQWTAAFGDHGTFVPVCATSFAPALTQIATSIGRVLGPQCLADTFRDGDPTTPVLDLECEVKDHYFDVQLGQTIETTLSACASNGNVPPCWTIAPNSTCTPSATGSTLFFSVARAAAPPSNLYTLVFCATCAPGFPGPGCP